MALVTFLTAWSCPTTAAVIAAPIFTSLLLSLWAILFTGMPVIIATTSAISSSLTGKRFMRDSSSHWLFAFSSSSSKRFSLSRRRAASSYFWLFTTWFFWFLISSTCFSSSMIFFGTWMFFKCTRAPTSSITSMALSGKKRSVIYRVESFTQASIASFE